MRFSDYNERLGPKTVNNYVTLTMNTKSFHKTFKSLRTEYNPFTFTRRPANCQATTI